MICGPGGIGSSPYGDSNGTLIYNRQTLGSYANAIGRTMNYKFGKTATALDRVFFSVTISEEYLYVSTTYDGKTYTLPYGNTVQGLIYNKDTVVEDE